jgi:hypothetical protein
MAILLMLTDRLVTSFDNSNMTKAAEASKDVYSCRAVTTDFTFYSKKGY